MCDKKSHKDNYKVETDNLAVPEVHTGKADKKDKKEQKVEEIEYEDLAIPEIHIKRKK